MAAYYGPMPEPDPGQHYNKYHWVATAMQKIRNECPKPRTGNITDKELVNTMDRYRVHEIVFMKSHKITFK